jgi:putative NADPH-quinone reductase
MNLVAFNGSPRKNGNTTAMLSELLRGARRSGASVAVYNTVDLHLRDCRGCLRCNVIKRCSLRGDDWPLISAAILQADVLVFAAPVYFHHLPASMKRLLDRFRSFLHVQITEDGLRHTPWQTWNKRLALLMCMGSPDETEARPACELFAHVTRMLGSGTTLQTILATRLALSGQIRMSEHELLHVYEKLHISAEYVPGDAARNRELLAACYRCGSDLGFAAAE